ncbi:hypothetical protein EDC01DRAFT_627664 [Geopyxis carbonaria]|nr:hypothetical protein EDC01DRAFT_627664 [Geopyxis carbonaria]
MVALGNCFGNQACITTKTIKAFAAFLHVRNIPGMIGLAAPGAEWWVNGTPPSVPWGGSKPFPDREPELEGQFNGFTSLNFTTLSITVDGSGRGALEARVRGEGPESGRFYENEVLQLFRINHEGEIEELREWIDPFAVFRYVEWTAPA